MTTPGSDDATRRFLDASAQRDGVPSWRAPAAPVVDQQGRTDDGSEHADREEGAPAEAQPAPWRQEARRWLATLNPGRTPREYEKAVGYFFGTPGAPQTPGELSFDLLLAYRGALALRATAHGELAPRRKPRSRPLLGATPRGHVSGGVGAGDHPDGAEPPSGQGERNSTTLLAPATVNLRLTALRQFLVHCALSGSLPQISPDRIRAALKRLSIERRRPYQVLAEPEWEQFLAAARLPLEAEREAERESAMATDGLADRAGVASLAAAPRSPWGVPRAVRLQRRQAQQSDAEPDVADAEASARLPRSKAGLTGARTAQRDYALIALALGTGLRAIELASLDVGDISREWHAGRQEWWLILPDEKTKGQRGGRLLPLDPALVETLLAYLASSGRRWESARDRATPLFIAGPARPRHLARPRTKREGHAVGDADESGRDKRWAPRRLSPNQIRRVVDRVETQWLALRAREAGATAEEWAAGDGVGETRAISPHALRHSTAIALLEGNDAAGRPPASVEHVRGWLGHFDIRTTQGYLSHLEGRKHRRPFTLAPGGKRERARGGDTAGKVETGPPE